MELPEANVSVEKRLYDAAKMGDLPTIKTLVQQDRFLVEQVLFARSRNVLHVATMAGREEIVAELLAATPALARDVDDKMSSALHIAAALGHTDIAQSLLFVAPEMCWRLDNQGMNPVHVAAAQGHVPVLEVLLKDDSSPGRELLDRRHTVLTLSMKHNRSAAFMFLKRKFPDLVSLKDADGETVFSLAHKYNRREIVDQLSTLDILTDGSIFQDITSMTMVIVGLIATMACQAAVNPPGGVWQDSTSSHKAGKAVVASSNSELYKRFSIVNTIAFASSMLVIFIVSTRTPNRSLFILGVIWVLTWVSIICITVSYGAAMVMTSPTETVKVGTIVGISILAYLCVFGMVCLTRLKR